MTDELRREILNENITFFLEQIEELADNGFTFGQAIALLKVAELKQLSDNIESGTRCLMDAALQIR